MCCFNFGKKVFSFVMTFTIGLSIANALQNEVPLKKSRIEVNSVKEFDHQNQGSGIGASSFDRMPETSKTVTNGLRIISKPRANYTDVARQNQTQGNVTLRVTFLANGSIGSVTPVNTLPDGLTERAISAARGIKFEPMVVNGKPVSVTKQVQYGFTLY